MIRTVLLENSHLKSANIFKKLQDRHDIIICNYSNNPDETLSYLATESKYDLIISSVDFRGVENIKLISKLNKVDKKPTLILTDHLHVSELREYYRSGASGFLSFNVNDEAIGSCLKLVRNGQVFLDQELLVEILNSNNEIEVSHPLTMHLFEEREMVVLKLISQGETNCQIAEQLFLSTRTVEGIRNMLIMKTGVKNTASLVGFAFRNRILK